MLNKLFIVVCNKILAIDKSKISKLDGFFKNISRDFSKNIARFLKKIVHGYLLDFYWKNIYGFTKDNMGKSKIDRHSGYLINIDEIRRN